MYAAVDIGGTKTLIAVFDAKGNLLKKFKFPTPRDYGEFITAFKDALATFPLDGLKMAAVAVPGVIDRKHGIGMTMGNLPWANVPVQHDFQKLLGVPVAVENDAKLAGLSEALLLKDKYSKVLYVTISTGIGIGLTVDGVINEAIGDTGGHDMYLEYNGREITWEALASGKSIVTEFGMRASEINDPDIWIEISKRIAAGLIELIALTQPEVVVFGGGVGAHFEKFKDFLEAELRSYGKLMVPLPVLTEAKNAEEAVVYGCYHLAKSAHAKTA